MLNFRRAQQLVTLADERSFTRAAAKLGMSQPALSRAIALIEAECGLRLFDRDRAGVALTAAGSGLVSDIRQILGQLRLTEQNLVMQGKGEAGRVRFAIGPLAASHLMDDLLSACVLRWPKLHLACSVLNTHSIASGVLLGDLDFGICSQNTLEADSSLRVVPLGTLEMGFFVRSGHPLARTNKAANWDEVARFPRASGYNRPLPDGRVVRPFAPLESTIECDDFEALRRVTLRTDTVWLSSRNTVGKDIADGTIVEITPTTDGHRQPAEIVVILLRGRSQLPAVEHLLEIAKTLMVGGIRA